MHGGVLTPIDEFLSLQQDLSAAERFAEAHERIPLGDPLDRWVDRMPATPPSEGQQYAFEVDLDACTGCKACVAACSSLNGLEEGETWRRTGTIHGVGQSGPEIQTVTTACHHCVEPACLDGCPAEAYEKDPITGIVEHLDDSCIGCRYCTLMCPYDVPDYRPSLGIVRKCDMCSDRLSEGEAPACVQGCPQGAITISVVDSAEVLASSGAAGAAIVPGAPGSALTAPTTTYATARPEIVGVDVTAVSRPAHSHPPLVVMLVLTQVAVGTYAADALMRATDVSAQSTRGVGLIALAAGLLALGASVLHLGRPLLAWRAVLGLGHSWLSREILAFAVFACLAMFDGALRIANGSSPALLTAGVLAAGLGGVLCSVKVYTVTGRAWWSFARTAGRFLSTSVIGGVLIAAIVTSFTSPAFFATGSWMTVVALGSASAAAVSVASALVVLPKSAPAGTRKGELAATRWLLGSSLKDFLVWRLICAALGCAFIPTVLAISTAAPGGSGSGETAALALALITAIAGEGIERHLFFVASAPPQMPGEPS